MTGKNIAQINKLLAKTDSPFDVEGAPRCIVGRLRSFRSITNVC